MRIDGYTFIEGKLKRMMITSSIEYAYEWMEYNRFRGVETVCSASELHKLDKTH